MDECRKCGMLDWEPHDPSIWRNLVDLAGVLVSEYLPPWKMRKPTAPYRRCQACGRVEKDLGRALVNW